MSKSAKEWIQTPPFPTSHFVDSRIIRTKVYLKKSKKRSLTKVGLLRAMRLNFQVRMITEPSPIQAEPH